MPLVATNDCYFADRAMYEAHDALLVAQGVTVSHQHRRRVTPEHGFKAPRTCARCSPICRRRSIPA